MKSRQRLLASLRGEKVDRTPWSPFLAYYWEHLPQDVQKMGQFSYMKQMGADPLLRGFHHLAGYTYRNCEIEQKQIGKEQFCTYRTPVGSITERFVYSEAGETWFIADHPVKTAEDFKILQYIYENTVISSDFERFESDKRMYGDDALLLPTIGVRSKTAFQSLVEHVTYKSTLARTAHTGNNCHYIKWELNVDTLQIVFSCTFYFDIVVP